MIEGVGSWVLRFPVPGRLEALLVRRATEPYYGEWFTVDGGIEDNESPETAALRELKEETSLVPRLLLSDTASPVRIETVRGDVWLHGFYAFVSAESNIRLNAEHSEWRWSSIESALRLVALPSQRDSLRRAVKRIEGRITDGILEATGAEQIDHPGGILHDHLNRTARLLAEFGSRPDLCSAGLLHAAYGTDGFAEALFPIPDRPILWELMGREAEQIVYLYGACDRRYFYASLLKGETKYRDRLSGRCRVLTTAETCDLVELTFANELDLARHDAGFREQHAASLVPLFQACREWASQPAYDCFTETFGIGRM